MAVVSIELSFVFVLFCYLCFCLFVWGSCNHALLSGYEKEHRRQGKGLSCVHTGWVAGLFLLLLLWGVYGRGGKALGRVSCGLSRGSLRVSGKVPGS